MRKHQALGGEAGVRFKAKGEGRRAKGEGRDRKPSETLATTDRWVLLPRGSRCQANRL